MTIGDQSVLMFHAEVTPRNRFFDWHELSHACSHPIANLFNLVATLKDFEIFHEFNYFVSLSAMVSFGSICACLRAAKARIALLKYPCIFKTNLQHLLANGPN